MFNRLLLALALSGFVASAWPVNVVSASLSRRELLAAAYPDWARDFDKVGGRQQSIRLAPIDLPDVAWPWLPSPDKNTTADRDTTTVEIVPLNVIRLDERHAVMITRALPLDDLGQPDCTSYGCLYAIGAYFFTQATGGWVLSKRMEAAAQTYSQGNLETRVIAWPGPGFLLFASLPFFAQGVESDSVFLMGLEPDNVSFSDDLPIAEASQYSGSTDCSEVLDASYEPPRRAKFETQLECRVGKGEWRVDGDAIQVHYERTIRKADAKGHLLPLKHLTDDVRLIPRKGHLEVVSGALPQLASEAPDVEAASGSS
jgi:hypothetical protein